jgi:2-C-methyl-D-erythritol 4-phosphate cytidylyltransferase/2-C-methyl-D-erythritol 2,4-cyclodiphosphate synthase
MTGVCALIPAAGRGVRFGSGKNKVFAPLLGRPLVGWTLEAFAQSSVVEDVILIGSEEDLPWLRECGDRFGGGKVRAVVPGGANRQESVLEGVAAAEGAQWLIVHDAARPCVPVRLIGQTLVASLKQGAATAAVPVTDTLVRGEPDGFTGENASREGLWAVQTPQTFRADMLWEAHRKARQEGIQGTDDAGLARRLGYSVALVPGSPENLKVTRPEDLALAEAILARREGAVQTPNIRIGYGYDVHPFAEGRRLFLGGVEFENAGRGLKGHSDADVLLHAVCDALLGAAGMGDIGTLFPDTEPAHKDRPSREFLHEVRARLDAARYRVGNVDITVLAEAPKIGPRADEMKSIIADALGIAPDRVGVKATTNEGMGFVGRGEGIAVHATALIYD